MGAVRKSAALHSSDEDICELPLIISFREIRVQFFQNRRSVFDYDIRQQSLIFDSNKVAGKCFTISISIFSVGISLAGF